MFPKELPHTRILYDFNIEIEHAIHNVDLVDQVVWIEKIFKFTYLSLFFDEIGKMAEINPD